MPHAYLISLSNLREFLSCLRVAFVTIRMVLLSQLHDTIMPLQWPSSSHLVVRLLYLLRTSIPRHTQYFIIVFFIKSSWKTLIAELTLTFETYHWYEYPSIAVTAVTFLRYFSPSSVDCVVLEWN